MKVSDCVSMIRASKFNWPAVWELGRAARTWKTLVFEELACQSGALTETPQCPVLSAVGVWLCLPVPTRLLLSCPWRRCFILGAGAIFRCREGGLGLFHWGKELCSGRGGEGVVGRAGTRGDGGGG